MKTVRLKREVIFVCSKCLKRHGDGKAIRRALKAQAKDRNARLVRSSCLGICPKKAVVVATRGSLAEGRVALVRDADEAGELLW